MGGQPVGVGDQRELHPRLPWTFWHWAKVVDPLADPGAHGGAPAEAFEVIVPSPRLRVLPRCPSTRT